MTTKTSTSLLTKYTNKLTLVAKKVASKWVNRTLLLASQVCHRRFMRLKQVSKMLEGALITLSLSLSSQASRISVSQTTATAM